MKKRITFISDTHSKHGQITYSLPGGDIIIHAGDISSMGYFQEITNFCKWFDDGLSQYDNKIFISGNHDLNFQDKPKETKVIVDEYDINYLEDSNVNIDGINVWGSPWQPEFHSWAFNLPRNGKSLREKWDLIPPTTDILITHGPGWGRLDRVKGRTENLGCELLTERINIIKPKIHVCGHIHSGYGLKEENGTLFINASVLNEEYIFTQKPITIDFDFETGEWDIVN